MNRIYWKGTIPRARFAAKTTIRLTQIFAMYWIYLMIPALQIQTREILLLYQITRPRPVAPARNLRPVRLAPAAAEHRQEVFLATTALGSLQAGPELARRPHKLYLLLNLAAAAEHKPEAALPPAAAVPAENGAHAQDRPVAQQASLPLHKPAQAAAAHRQGA